MSIELKNINFAYGENMVLKDFNLTVNDGECVCLSGRSGCGKTTVSRLITGLEAPQSGSVMAPKRISVVFQEDRLLNHLTLEENIYFPLSLPFEMLPNADSLIERLGLAEYKKSKVSQLSGGMKRRVAIARAILYEGDALVLDEPFNGLDEENRKIVADIIKEVFLERQKPVFLITHIKEDAQLLNAKIIEM